MKRILDWIKDRFFYQDDEADEPLNQTGVRVRPRPPQQKPAAAPPPEFEAGLVGRIEDGGPGKNILVRNKYLSDDADTHDALKIIDDTGADSNEGGGIDPYNTGRFDRSKSWDSSRSRK